MNMDMEHRYCCNRPSLKLAILLIWGSDNFRLWGSGVSRGDQ